MASPVAWRNGVLSIGPALAAIRRVTTYDMRGHGLSDMPASGYAIADLAEELQALLDDLCIDKVDIVAHSFGAGRRPDVGALLSGQVRSLVLADAVVPSLADDGRIPADTAAALRFRADPFETVGGQAMPQFEQGSYFVPFGLWNRSGGAAARLNSRDRPPQL